MEESIAGGRCFAAPILSADGTAAGAVSLSMPLSRFRGEESRRVILAAVRETANAIAKRLH